MYTARGHKCLKLKNRLEVKSLEYIISNNEQGISNLKFYRTFLNSIFIIRYSNVFCL